MADLDAATIKQWRHSFYVSDFGKQLVELFGSQTAARIAVTRMYWAHGYNHAKDDAIPRLTAGLLNKRGYVMMSAEAGSAALVFVREGRAGRQRRRAASALPPPPHAPCAEKLIQAAPPIRPVAGICKWFSELWREVNPFQDVRA